MDAEITAVRSRVLALIGELNQEDFDEQDLDLQVRNRDALIKCFITQHKEHHDNVLDVEIAARKMVETMKWRKSLGLAKRGMDHFPSELWTTDQMYVFEDEKYFIIVYPVLNDRHISDHWTDLRTKFVLRLHSELSLEALHAGKQVVVIGDVSGLRVGGVDISMHSGIVKLLDRHIPCLFHVFGIIGLPFFLTGLANVFMRMTMPYSMKKRFRVYDEKTIQAAIPPQYLPTLLGGDLKMKDLMDSLGIRPKSLATNFEDWQMTESDARKILQAL